MPSVTFKTVFRIDDLGSRGLLEVFDSQASSKLKDINRCLIYENELAFSLKQGGKRLDWQKEAFLIADVNL